MEHIPHHEFAAFVDETCTDAEHRRIRVHLDACPQCFDAYRDAVRVLGTAGRDEYARLPADVAARAMSLGGRSRARRTLPPWQTGAVVAATLVIAALLVRVANHEPEFDPFAPQLAPITESMIGYGGQLVFPDTEAYLPDSPATVRSTSGTDNPETDAALKRLLDRFRRGETSAHETYWLAAGYASRGEGGIAREVIEVSRKHSRDDARFLCVEAILDYRNSDLAAAREKLERAVEATPRSAEAHHDLSVVLKELADEEGARLHHARALKYARGSAIAKRGLK